MVTKNKIKYRRISRSICPVIQVFTYLQMYLLQFIGKKLFNAYASNACFKKEPFMLIKPKQKQNEVPHPPYYFIQTIYLQTKCSNRPNLKTTPLHHWKCFISHRLCSLPKRTRIRCRQREKKMSIPLSKQRSNNHMLERDRK